MARANLGSEQLWKMSGLEDWGSIEGLDLGPGVGLEGRGSRKL